MANRWRLIIPALLCCFTVLLLSGCNDDGTRPSLVVATPGVHNNLVSGTTALIAVARSKQTTRLGVDQYTIGDLKADNIQVKINDRNVTDQFKTAELASGDEVLLGRLKNLKPGENSLRVTGPSGSTITRTLNSYPVSGPIFSGPQQEPFICQTQASGLGMPLDPDKCNIKTRHFYKYLSTDTGQFEHLGLHGNRPDDVKMITTSQGKKVPFIVRVEIGTRNRAIYSTAILANPFDTSSIPNPWNRTNGWNGRLVYVFGGGCGPGHHQGTLDKNAPRALKKGLLSKGYAVAGSTLNVFQISCNPLLSAETAYMVKQHFVKEYGVPVYTMGSGGSGGAIQQYEIADNYPGILDGITPSMSFPDPFIAPGVTDCGLLVHYFKNKTNLTWASKQKAAVADEGLFDSCQSWHDTFLPLVNASKGCASVVSQNFPIFDPDTNPDGLRCTLENMLRNVLGINPKTGYARDPVDNVGVQYGLQALNNGTITPQQFVKLNKNIGSYDINGEHQEGRFRGDKVGIKNIFASGGLVTAEGGLGTTPIIDWRSYFDKTAFLANIHTSFYSYTVRKRLKQAAGDALNQVIMVQPLGGSGISRLSTILTMDDWLANIRSDHSNKGTHKKIAQHKPSGLTDSCFDQNGNRIVPDHRFSHASKGQCHTLYPPFGDPRVGAGGPINLMVPMCHLKPLKRSDYAPQVQFTGQQFHTLEQIFPNGVCDYTKPSIGKVPYEGTWQSFDQPNYTGSGDTT